MLKGDDGFLSIILNKIIGGYDVKCALEIKSANYYVKGDLWITKEEIYNFYHHLQQCYNEVAGKVNYNSYEGNLSFQLKFDSLGHVLIKGEFREKLYVNNVLMFEFESDQSYLNSTLSELKQIVKKYGGTEGV